jgi:hypothetical protein
MEEDGGAGSGEPFAAAGGAGGSSAGNGGGAKLPQVLQKSCGEVQGILEHNRVRIQEISQNQETKNKMRSVQKSIRAFTSYTAQIRVHEV